MGLPPRPPTANHTKARNLSRLITVYSDPETTTIDVDQMILDDGNFLPGFSVRLDDKFAELDEPMTNGEDPA